MHMQYKQTSTPLGVPHQLVKEDNYRGYVVPGGTTILANAWYVPRTSPYQGSRNPSVLILILQGDDAQ